FAAFAVCVLLLDVPGYAWRSAGRVLEAGDPVREAVHRSWLKGAASGAVFAGAVSAIYAFGAHRRLAGVLLPLLIFAEVWNGNGLVRKRSPGHHGSRLPPARRARGARVVLRGASRSVPPGRRPGGSVAARRRADRAQCRAAAHAREAAVRRRGTSDRSASRSK